MGEWLNLPLPIRSRALPADDEVECWLVDLAALVLPSPGGRASEWRQALRLRRQFLLRLILSAYLDRPGKDIALIRGAAGKPALAPSLAGSGLHFNLSHSGQWLAVAVGCGGLIGVDIERQRSLGRASDLARRYFSQAEAAHLAALVEPARSTAFFHLWTVREACIKAMGTSLAQSLNALVLAPPDGALLRVPPGWPPPQSWSVRRLPSSLPLHGCLAAPRPGVRITPILLDCKPA